MTAFETEFTEKATKIGITALCALSLLAAANEATEIAAACASATPAIPEASTSPA